MSQYVKLDTRINDYSPAMNRNEYVIQDDPECKRIYFKCQGKNDCRGVLAVQRVLIDDVKNPGTKIWAGWSIVDLVNLTARESILCGTCGWHVYLTNGEFTDHNPDVFVTPPAGPPHALSKKERFRAIRERKVAEQRARNANWQQRMRGRRTRPRPVATVPPAPPDKWGLPLKATFIREVGTRVSLRVYWGQDCPNHGYHDAKRFLFDVPETISGRDDNSEKWSKHHGGNVQDYAIDQWPVKCDRCGTPVPESAERQVFNERLYDTPSGKPEIGNLFYAPWYDDIFWDNQVSPTLCAILPNGQTWIIDSRASNCTLPEDRTHRCWVRHGNPETGIVHVDKNGHTCAAGAGSIQAGDFHGFLHNGYFTL